MQTDRRKELRDAYKSRRPDMGVVELRCTATGQRFLGITRDAAKELNSLRAKLNGGGHPNRPLQQLWSEHGENGFDFRVADTLEYENPRRRLGRRPASLARPAAGRRPRSPQDLEVSQARPSTLDAPLRTLHSK